MALPTPNDWTNLLALESVLGANAQLEKRMVNSDTGQIQYVGYTMTPNANEALPIWFIVKLSYDVNGFLNYYQLPVNGPGFIYIWNDMASYF